MNLFRQIRLCRIDQVIDQVEIETFDASTCGPVRLEVECGKSTVALQLTVDVAHRLGRALLRGVVGLVDPDALERKPVVEPLRAELRGGPGDDPLPSDFPPG